MRLHQISSSRLMADLYQDTCDLGYENMLLGLLDIMLNYSEQMEIVDYHTVLCKMSFCYNYFENWDSFDNKILYIRDKYPETWDKILAHTETLTDIWEQVLTRRTPDDSTEYFGYREDLKIINILTR